jgi:hypothetical protein
MYENTADIQHIACLHLTPGFTGNLLKKSIIYYIFLKLINFEWVVEWNAGKDSTKHNVDWLFEMIPTVLGIKTCTYRSIGRLIGPALMINTVQMIITKNWKLEVSCVNGIIQTAPLKNQLTFHWYSKPGLLNNLFAKYIQVEYMGQVTLIIH